MQSVRQIEKWNGRALVAMEMGMGKSLVALWWARYFLNQWPIIVVCPASLKWNWQAEARTHINLGVEILSGVRSYKKKYLDPPRGRKIYVVNYDVLGPTKRGPGWLDFLLSLDPKLVIADESHMI